MELKLEEQTLLATFRSLDHRGRNNELLRLASLQRKKVVVEEGGAFYPAADCRIDLGEERHEALSAPALAV